MANHWIEWGGDIKDGTNANDSIPSSTEIVWGGHTKVYYDNWSYTTCWDDGDGGKDGSQCTAEPSTYYFEDLDVTETGDINTLDAIACVSIGCPTALTNYIVSVGIAQDFPIHAPKPRGGDNTYTWGDVRFISEIADGIGTGSRRARQERLNKFLKDEDKKKKLIHLICRVDGIKVYDGKKEAGTKGDIKVEKVEMLIKEILGKVKIKDVL